MEGTRLATKLPWYGSTATPAGWSLPRKTSNREATIGHWSLLTALLGLGAILLLSFASPYSNYLSAEIVGGVQGMPQEVRSLTPALPSMATVPVSNIEVPFKVKLKAVQDFFNGRIPTTLVQSNMGRKVLYDKMKLFIHVYCSCVCEASVERAGDLSITGSNNEVKLQLPVDAYGHAHSFRGECSMFGAIHVHGHADAHADVSAEVSLDLGTGWNPIVKVTSDYSLSSNLVVDIGGVVKIGLGSVLTPTLKTEVDKQIQKIPQYISKFAVQQKMRELWLQIQQPHPISTSPNASLVIVPQKAFFSGLNIENDVVTGSVGLQVQAAVVLLQSVATRTVQPVLLPDLIHGTPPTSNFTLICPLIVHTADIERSARDQLSDDLDALSFQVLKDGDTPVNATIIDFYSDPELVPDEEMIKLSKVGGVISLSEAGVSRAPIELAVWETVKEPLGYSYSSSLKQLAAKAQGALNRDLLPGLAKLSGALSGASATNLQIGDDAVAIQITLSGSAQVDIDFW